METPNEENKKGMMEQLDHVRDIFEGTPSFFEIHFFKMELILNDFSTTNFT